MLALLIKVGLPILGVGLVEYSQRELFHVRLADQFALNGLIVAVLSFGLATISKIRQKERKIRTNEKIKINRDKFRCNIICKHSKKL